jgi:hypothetical protein
MSHANRAQLNNGNFAIGAILRQERHTRIAKLSYQSRSSRSITSILAPSKTNTVPTSIPYRNINDKMDRQFPQLFGLEKPSPDCDTLLGLGGRFPCRANRTVAYIGIGVKQEQIVPASTN